MRYILFLGLSSYVLFGALAFLIPSYSRAQSFQAPCIKNLTPVAKRLGVKPTYQPSLLVASACDGKTYDIVALIDALLDRMDRQARVPRPIEAAK